MCEIIPFPKPYARTATRVLESSDLVLAPVHSPPVYVPPLPPSYASFDARQRPFLILPWIAAALTATAASCFAPAFLESLPWFN
jgi:hypothetical protein